MKTSKGSEAIGRKSMIVREIKTITKVIDGKVIIVKDKSLYWNVPIYHLS